MAKSTNKRSNPMANRLKLIGLVILTLLLIAGVYLKFFRSSDNNNSSSTNTSQQAEARADSQAKKQAIESGDSSGDHSVPSNDTETTESGSITGLSAQQETNGTVTVLTKLVSGTTGTCTVTAKNGSKTTTKTAAILYQSEFSTCEGFSIPISELGSGQWELSLAVGSSTKSTTLQVAQ